MDNYKFDIAFVILSYKAPDITAECIESIITNIDTEKYLIIVVDNASQDGTCGILKEKYLCNSKIIFIELEENIGFARGNNIGIKKAREYDVEFICCTNNDTILEQDNFWVCLKRKYYESNAALIGPEVIRLSGKVQKFNTKLGTVDEYKKQLKAICYDSDLSKAELIKRKLLAIPCIGKLNNLRHKKPISPSICNECNYPEMQDVMLHGCCLIFTPIFFKKGLLGFNERTFLYREEQLLFLSLMQNGLHSLYTPEIKIKHIGKVSTNIITNNDAEKLTEFQRDNEIKSLKILIDELEKI